MDTTMHSRFGLKTVFAAAAASALLSACGGGGGGGSGNSPVEVVGTSGPQFVRGVAATGQPVGAAPVFVLNAAGERFDTVSGSDGAFTVEVTGQGPFLVAVDVPCGPSFPTCGRLYGMAQSAGVVNVNQITDAVVRAASPADHLKSADGSYSLVNYVDGMGVLPPLDIDTGVDQIANTQDDLILIVSESTRKLLNCSQTDEYLSGAARLSAAEFVSCYYSDPQTGTPKETFLRAIYTQFVDLTWSYRSADYAANLPAAKASVIQALGVERIKALTTTADPDDLVDLSVVDPMTVQFVAGSQKGFDGLLDRLVSQQACESTSSKCNSVFTLYDDVGRTTKASVPQLVVGSVADDVASQCKVGAEALPTYTGAAAGSWSLDVRTETPRAGEGYQASASSGLIACPAVGTTYSYVGGPAGQIESYTTNADATSAQQIKSGQHYTCADFAVGSPSEAKLAWVTPGAEFVAFGLGNFGPVLSCQEVATGDGDGQTSFGVKVAYAEQTITLTYRKVK